MEEDILGILFGVALFVLMIFLIVTAGTVMFFAAIPAGIGYSIYWFQVKSPAAQERQASERTLQLYNAVKCKFTAIDIAQFIGDRIGYPDGGDHNVDVQFSIASRLVGSKSLIATRPRRQSCATPLRVVATGTFSTKCRRRTLKSGSPISVAWRSSVPSRQQTTTLPMSSIRLWKPWMTGEIFCQRRASVWMTTLLRRKK